MIDAFCSHFQPPKWENNENILFHLIWMTVNDMNECQSVCGFKMAAGCMWGNSKRWIKKNVPKSSIVVTKLFHCYLHTFSLFLQSETIFYFNSSPNNYLPVCCFFPCCVPPYFFHIKCFEKWHFNNVTECIVGVKSDTFVI